MLVRFIAISLLAVTLVDLALYWVVAQHNHTEMTIFPCVLKSIPAVIGLVLLLKARNLPSFEAAINSRPPAVTMEAP